MPILPQFLTGIKLKCAHMNAAWRMKRSPAAPGWWLSVLAAAQRGLVDSPVDVLVQSGETLRIYFTKSKMTALAGNLS